MTREIVIDSFAGGGGASVGIEMAGRSVDIAINHNAEALTMHAANHPNTKHYCENVWDVDPAEATQGRPVGLMWLSPDCTFHSKARGGKPFRDRKKARRTRGLAWLAIRWAKAVRPRVLMLENVEEFAKWGPLDDDGKPCPIRKGMTFRRWCKQLENLGYRIDMREIRACDYGTPTIRKRLFIIARCDGEDIVFPEPTHGPGLLPYRTAAECIDWSIPCPSIFERKRLLVEATMRRIANGIRKYVIENPSPFIVGIDNRSNGDRAPDVSMPTIVPTANGATLCAAFLAKHFGGNETPGWPLGKSISTLTARDHHALVTSNLVKYKGTSKDGQPVDEPLHTVQANGNHYAEVRAFLLKYYGTDQDPRLKEPLHTLTTKARFGLVTVAGIDYQIVDIGMRMLQPRELYRAQGFPDSYVIDPEFNGKPMTKTAQVRMCGNSVCPQVVEALVSANYANENRVREAV